MKIMFTRNFHLPRPGTESFFLWGPRQTGKSTLLRQTYGDCRWVDLLKAEEFRRYMARPEPAAPGDRGRGARRGRQQIVIDEIQKVPALLDEVHWLIENRRLHFALCGSSARKVKRGAANLLGGRAMRYELHGLTAGPAAGHPRGAFRNTHTRTSSQNPANMPYSPITSVALGTGFLIFMLSSMHNLAAFGQVIAFAVTAALAADLFVAPALMALVVSDIEERA